MKRLCHLPVVALALALILPLPSGAWGQSDARDEAYRQYKALSDQGRYGEAEPFARKALKLGEEEFGREHAATAALLSNLARLYEDQGRYTESEPLHKRALTIWEKALRPEHPDVAQSLNNLALENYAGLLRDTGRIAEAEKMEARAKAIRAKQAAQNPVK